MPLGSLFVGVTDPQHALSHHQNNDQKLANLAKVNTYHVQTFAYYLDQLRATQDGDGTLLDHTLLLYGSGMSDGNTHNNYSVPVVVIGGRENGLEGNRHLVYPDGTPLATLSLSLMKKFGVNVETFGDSTGHLPLLSGV